MKKTSYFVGLAVTIFIFTGCAKNNQSFTQLDSSQKSDPFSIEIEQQTKSLKRIQDQNVKVLSSAQKSNSESAQSIKDNQNKAGAQKVSNDIKDLRTELAFYFNNRGTYPDNLKQLFATLQGKKSIPLVDPMGSQYNYQKIGEDYELCFNIIIKYDDYYEGGNCINNRGQIRKD